MNAEVLLSRWPCHIHNSSSCEMAIVRSANETRQYHIISISKTSLAAQKYNVKNEPDKFWEKLPPGRWFCSLWYSSEMRDFSVFKSLYQILYELDVNKLKYETDKPLDFLKKHVIVNGEGCVALCNHHLIKAQRTSNVTRTLPPSYQATTTLLRPTIADAAEVPSAAVLLNGKARYTTHISLTRLIKSMFPQSTSNQIANSTPEWALGLLRELSDFGSENISGTRRSNNKRL